MLYRETRRLRHSSYRLMRPDWSVRLRNCWGSSSALSAAPKEPDCGPLSLAADADFLFSRCSQSVSTANRDRPDVSVVPPPLAPAAAPLPSMPGEAGVVPEAKPNAPAAAGLRDDLALLAAAAARQAASVRAGDGSRR